MVRGEMSDKIRGRLQGLLAILLACVLATGCSGSGANSRQAETTQSQETTAVEQVQEEKSVSADTQDASGEPAASPAEEPASTTLDLAAIPAYSGSASTPVLGNAPQFSDADKTRGSFEEYSALDTLGRCGVAFALIGTETMPTAERGSIGMIKPSGWHTVRYDGLVDGNYLYNRCHLIGYQLAGENANTKNLITGTRYLNVDGMLPYENEVADYVERTGNHVLYRVTPWFEGSNLVATGVQMEAWSVEDAGAGVSFNVWCYNVQPGVSIDYATGDSALAEGATTAADEGAAESAEAASGESDASTSSEATEQSYILNTNTRKFHRTGCGSAKKIKAKNREDFTGTRDEVIARGFEPCKNCNP